MITASFSNDVMLCSDLWVEAFRRFLKISLLMFLIWETLCLKWKNFPNHCSEVVFGENIQQVVLNQWLSAKQQPLWRSSFMGIAIYIGRTKKCWESRWTSGLTRLTSSGLPSSGWPLVPRGGQAVAQGWCVCGLPFKQPWARKLWPKDPEWFKYFPRNTNI